MYTISHKKPKTSNDPKMAEPKNLTSYFHGTLEAIIDKAEPTSCLFSSLHSPAFVSIHIGNTTVAETTRHRHREWNQRFRILCAHSAGAVVTVALRTRLLVLAKVGVLASELMDGKGEWKKFEGVGKVMRLVVSMRFWGKDERVEKVAGSFPARGNCGVLLYQDAHHGAGFRPPVRGYRPRRLWEDLFRVIDGAEKLVCIAGWSLNPKLVLVRDPHSSIPEAIGVELGALLKRKADDGVAVRILLWDDETSLPFIKNRGLMRTHDEDALSFFRHTNAICRLCPRPSRRHLPSLFTHHQKTITADASPLLLRSLGLSAVAAASPRRELLSFVGGLDLCDGRYDTERHSLFRALDAGDFYQASIAGASIDRGGPRQPWHDCHACVAGGAARDVLANFEQRWAKHGGAGGAGAGDGFSLQTAVDGTWNVQVFRSIDRTSVERLPENMGTSEHSIHDAYVSAIRRAERFVYIENQYFMGGCHFWDKDAGSGCTNLIPIEIALKVGDKIRAGERFAAYVVVPMWPEGSADGEAVQDMLHWIRMTMAMMYRLVGEAIRESGVRAHPRDYLNFFCLANREEKREGDYAPPRGSSPSPVSHYWKAQKNRRFMIYVHSKVMIVDDEYILIGSANLNQRSMDGGRDTEIAIGCYQPDAINDGRGGDVSAYRMSLWYEHAGKIEAPFAEPQSLECVSTLREIGDEMWKKYSGEELVDMEGVHLVSYPVNVLEDGSVEDLEGGGGAFPDTSALVSGRRSKILPPICTT